MRKQLVIRPGQCIGCRSCELVCAGSHGGCFGPVAAAVMVVELGEREIPILCMHCEEPACVPVCPVAALEMGPDGGVEYREGRCIRCKLCVAACPLGNLRFDRERGRVVKCDRCGGEPRCVRVCPVGAIDWRECGELVALPVADARER